MKKLIALVVVTLVITTLYTAIQSRMEEQFNFSLMYNVNGNDYISTYDKQLTIDTVSGQKTIEFELSRDDLAKIEEKIKELGIMEDDFTKLPYSGLDIGFNAKYELRITLDGVSKTITWTTGNSNARIKVLDNQTDGIDDEYARVNKLFDLKNFIVEIVTEYEEYEKLPPHKMYL